MKSFTILAGLAAGVSGLPHYMIANHQLSAAVASNSSIVLAPSKDPWYTAPPNFESATPGSILRLRATPGNLTGIVTNSSASYNILYRTTDSNYKATWAVTTLFLPATSIASTNNKLLSYQIPYDSAFVDSSPSYALYGGASSDITGALGRGWYVSVPDYEGPLASFTAGVQSGHATIDSIRAVLNSGFGLVNGTKYAMRGSSGGALASEWAAELQVQYAPEMNFAGAVLENLTPNVTSVLAAVTGKFTAGLVPAGILGLASQNPDLMALLERNLKTSGPYNATTFFNAKNQTLIQTIITFMNQTISDYFVDGDAALNDPIARRITQRDGIMGYHGVPQMPLFVPKAIADEISPVVDTDVLVERYCNIGATINYERNTLGSHGTPVPVFDAQAFAFLDSVLSGTYNVTGCQVANVTYGNV